MNWESVWQNLVEGLVLAASVGAVAYLRSAYNRFKSMDSSLTSISLDMKSAMKLLEDHARMLEEHSDRLDEHDVRFAHMQGILERK